MNYEAIAFFTTKYGHPSIMGSILKMRFKPNVVVKRAIPKQYQTYNPCKWHPSLHSIDPWEIGFKGIDT
jgi:hypothetical protein